MGLAPYPPADRISIAVWLYIEVPACRVSPWCGSKEVRELADPVLGMPAAVPIHLVRDLECADDRDDWRGPA